LHIVLPSLFVNSLISTSFFPHLEQNAKEVISSIYSNASLIITMASFNSFAYS
jgi:hypothetical protein